MKRQKVRFGTVAGPTWEILLQRFYILDVLVGLSTPDVVLKTTPGNRGYIIYCYSTIDLLAPKELFCMRHYVCLQVENAVRLNWITVTIVYYRIWYIPQFHIPLKKILTLYTSIPSMSYSNVIIFCTTVSRTPLSYTKGTINGFSIYL